MLVRRVVFHSRTVETPEGKQPSEIFAAIVRPVSPVRYPGLLVLHGGGGSAKWSVPMRWPRRGTSWWPRICRES